MARLDRYVASTVLGAYFAALLFLLGMFVVFDLLFEMNTYMRVAEQNDMGLFELMGKLVKLNLLGLPNEFVTIAPFVTVIASMFALSKLMGANEIAPMVFTGRSMFRVLRPMLGVAVLSALAMGITWQWIMPLVTEDFERARAELRGNALELRKITLRSPDQSRQELFCAKYHHDRQLMVGVILYDRGSNRRDGIYVEADSAQYNPDKNDWNLTGGTRRILRDEVYEVSELRLLGMSWLTPSLILDSDKAQRQTSSLSYTELLDLMQARAGKNDYILAFHVHFTFPLANIVLVLLALPFAVNFERGRKIERVLFAILICAGYLVMDLTCQNLVFGDFVHPIVAAWTPTIVFGSLGAVVFGSMRS